MAFVDYLMQPFGCSITSANSSQSIINDAFTTFSLFFKVFFGICGVFFLNQCSLWEMKFQVKIAVGENERKRAMSAFRK